MIQIKGAYIVKRPKMDTSKSEILAICFWQIIMDYLRNNPNSKISKNLHYDWALIERPANPDFVRPNP